MAFLRPVELEIEGFRSFKDKSIVRFPESGALLINGHYTDSATSSGSGKSSLLMALAYALGFSDLPATELKNWDSKNIFVRLVLSDGTNTYEIIRDPSLKLIINGTRQEGTSQASEQKITEIIKTPLELTKALTYRPQRSTGKFINSTDSENKEFLSSLLGLTDIESSYEDMCKELTTLDNNIKNTVSNLEYIKTSLDSIKVSDEEYKIATKSYEDAKIRLDRLSDNDEEVKRIFKEVDTIDAELFKINKVSREVQTATYQNTSIRSQVEQLNSEIATLRDNTCPTCKREWDNTESLISLKQDKIKSLMESMRSNIILINNSTVLTNPDYSKGLNHRKLVLQQSLGQIKAPLEDAKNAVRMAESNLITVTKNRNKYQELQQTLKTKQEELVKFEFDKIILNHSSEILSRTGFLGAIFDEVLVDINNRTNDLMSCIPNVNTFTLNISSATVTKTGKINKKIEISVFKDGKKIPIKALSGGQKTSIELCTDLAVSETIRSRCGSNLGWVALDEALDGLGVETKLAALEVIKSKINGLIIVVDHSTEIKEIFDKVIEVEFDGRNSHAG